MKTNKQTLSDWLVKNILDDTIEENEKPKIKKIVVIYPGRFQPMGKHHAEIFKWTQKKFPNADAYVATSNKVELPKSPFNFKEKQKIINAYGIKNVVQVKNPYIADEILSKYDPETTAVIFVVGLKDMEENPRFKIGTKRDGNPTYYQYYNKNKDNLFGYEKHGYIIVAPHISLNIPGYGEMSGTQIRKALGDKSIDDKKRRELFKAIFGHDKKPIYNLVVNKLLSLNELMEEFAKYIDYPNLVVKLARKRLIKENSIIKSKADFHALNLGRNIVEYILGNNILYQEQYKNNQKWKNYVNGIMIKSGYNFVKFIMEILKNKRNSKIKKLAEQFTKKLIREGGAYGHMEHPFDDNNLTFGDFKELIRQSLQGELSIDTLSEKTDGQNLMITWKNGKLLAARNNSQIKNPISISEISKMFAGRGDVHDAFVYAMMDLDAAISKLSQKDRDRIFNNGKNFMNLEIIYPATKNVIDYDRAMLQFHGALIYDETGNVVGEVPNSGTLLANMIKKVNQNTQKHFNIEGPQKLIIKKDVNFAEKQEKFLSQLNKLQSRFNLKDTDTLGMYHQAWWNEFISKKAQEMKYAIPNNVLVGLIKRWAFFDKSYDIRNIKKDITNPEFLNWVLKFDKEDHNKYWKENITPFENLILSLGVEVLKNVEGFLSANPNKTVQSIRKQVADTIRTIRSSGDLKTLQKMETQLKRIQALGGFKQIVPAEGIVFKFKGKTYKLTGIFAPINNLLGIIKYSR